MTQGPKKQGRPTDRRVRKRTGYENECHRRAKQESRAKVEADEDYFLKNYKGQVLKYAEQQEYAEQQKYAE